MKKLLFSLSVLLLVLGCLVSCVPSAPSDHTTASSDDDANNPPAVDANFVSPSDEESAVYTVSKTDACGLKLEITFHGYKSESLNKNFYVKNNEYFIADIKLTNESDAELYQYLPTICRQSSDIPHNHEIGFDIAAGEYKLNSSSFGFGCPAAYEVWTIESGQSYEWHLKLAAGEVQHGKQDLPSDGKAYSAGIKLYGKDIFTDNACVFDGEFTFSYKKDKEQLLNTDAFSVPVSVEVVYVSSSADRSE